MPNIATFEFEVGVRYRNRRGEYDVISIDHPLMQIRYQKDGELATVDVVTQRRIFCNMGEEDDVKQIIERQAAAKARARQAPRAPRPSAKRVAVAVAIQ